MNKNDRRLQIPSGFAPSNTTLSEREAKRKISFPICNNVRQQQANDLMISGYFKTMNTTEGINKDLVRFNDSRKLSFC